MNSVRFTRFTILSLLLILSVHPRLHSQAGFDAEIRPRTEYSHGYGSLAAEDQDGSLFTSQRTRLNLQYNDTRLSFRISLQDVRVWGNQPQLVTNEDFATSIHEAWAEAHLTEAISLRLGRQELVYDDHRIFGNVGWAQQGRSHDLLLVRYEGAISLHLGAAYHQNSNRSNSIYDGPDAYKTMQFLWGNRKWENLSLSVLFLNNGTPFTEVSGPGGTILEQSIRFSQTFGPRVIYNNGDLSVSGNFYYQGGKDSNSNTLRAFEFAGQAELQPLEQLKVTAGYEFLSGTSYSETGINRSFTPFYGTNHKFNGHMDYFYVGNHTNNAGLQDAVVKGAFRQGRISAGMDIHFFLAAAAVADGASYFLGTEFDLAAGYKFTDNINFNIGYSHLLPSESMEILKGGSRNALQNWAWLMVTFTPQIWNQGE